MTGETARGETAWHARASARETGADAVLRAEGLALDGAFEPVDFAVRPGEVLGLAGATASGNTALGETLVGPAPGHRRAAPWSASARYGPAASRTRSAPGSATCPRTGTGRAWCPAAASRRTPPCR